MVDLYVSIDNPSSRSLCIIHWQCACTERYVGELAHLFPPVWKASFPFPITQHCIQAVICRRNARNSARVLCEGGGGGEREVGNQRRCSPRFCYEE